MYEPPPGYETVFRTRQRDECLASRLVLSAAGISAEAGYRDGWWLLVVNSADLAISDAELEAYRQENPVQSAGQNTAVPVYGGAAAAVLVYAGIIILIFVLTSESAFGLEWLTAGRMQAGSVMAGESWRTVTALTLHLDAGHILSNLVFGAVFGLLAGHVLGGGVAWLTIVVAGALGNFINAMVQSPTHSSIGASTAVFAALGVIVSHALRPRSSVQERPLRRWSPLIGGVLLLAFTGVGGEHTDVVAHLTGFLAGLMIGWVGCGLPDHWLASGAIQKSAGLATVALVALAWIVGLVVAG
jgi:membrane associated rhomboid family serine protease